MRDALQLVGHLARLSRGIPRAAWRIAAALALCILSGTFFSLLVATIGAAITQGLDRALLLRFLALCVATPCARLASQLLFDAIGTRAIADLRLDLCRRLLAAPLSRLEELGPRRLLAALGDDVAVVAAAASLLPTLAMQVGVAAGLLAYMAWLSPRWFLLVVGGLALGLGVMRLPGLLASRYQARASRETETLSARLRDLIEGAKELALHREGRRAFLDRELVPAGEALQRSTFLGAAASTAANAWHNVLFFALPAMVLFGAGWSGAGLPVLAGYALALLYLRTPTGTLLEAAPALARGNAAAAALERLASELSAGGGEPEGSQEEGFRETWKRLELRAVTHTYGGRDDGDRFALGPVSLQLAPGEIVFVVGGNGSGKTTLAKVLTGLYPPGDGQILLDDVAIRAEDRDGYRQMFSAVFADSYPFETLARPGADGAGRALARFLKRLRLEGKVDVGSARVSARDLAPGERRRLALVSARLEDRPICIFDEWAAGQDPSARQVFYLELLPEMKARGKAVVVISNDDAYYPVADRLIRLTQGQIEWERRPPAGPLGASGPA
jgi:putative ATP-binding cassette transporter